MVFDLPLAILVNHLWQSTLFAGAVWGLTLLLRRNSARVRHALWLAASLKFLVPFALLAALSAQIPWHAEPESSGTAAGPAIVNLAANLAAPMAGDSPYPSVLTQPDDHLEQLDKLIVFSALILWLIGALFVAVRWMVRWFDVRRALRNSTTMASIDFPVPVRITGKQFEPGVVGVFRPKLLLPAGIEERLTPEQMHAVLAHERCHLRWRDNFTASLHMLVETLFWYFPPVWWIGARLIEERERACDEQVVRDGHAPEGYAEGILNVCEHYIASRLPCVSGVSGSDLRKRIEYIVKRSLGVKLDGRRKLVLASAACCTVAAPIAAGMISGSAFQVLFSLDPGTAAMNQYWLTSSESTEASMVYRSGPNLAAYSCPDPDPGAALIERQKALAALVAKLPTRHDKALLYAVAANSRADVERLLAAGAPRSGDSFMLANSLMHTAAELGDVQMLELLANAGLSINERSGPSIAPAGRTPLMSAIGSGRLRNAYWLIEHGADASAADKYDQSPLVLAMVSCRDKALVSRLLKAGAKPDFKALRIADNIGFDLRTDAAQQAPPLQSWRIPAEYTATADFDGDGTADVAALHMSIDDKSKGVFVKLSSRGSGWVRATAIDPFMTPANVALMQMSIAKPDTYVTRCASNNTCREGQPATLTLAQPGIDFFLPEGAHCIVHWDKTAEKFECVGVAIGK